jgi:polyribonucleotide nucleotidyltransferase
MNEVFDLLFFHLVRHYKEKSNVAILSDIMADEDHFGDMDFKVAGTKDGVTAIQMDVKVSGVPIPALAVAFEKAKNAA